MAGELLTIVPPGPDRDRYLGLLMLADDSEAQVRGYYQTGVLYALVDESGATLGITLAIPNGDAVELKAVAVQPDRQGRGIGQCMLAAVIDALRTGGTRRVVLGTGNSSIGQIAFYQKVGFRLWKIERDFFSPERGYPADIRENGILLRDMVWLDRDLTARPDN